MRCFGDGDPLYERYHDEEWGVPVRDERGLYERVSLEAFQSGLSWITILRKREGFRTAFAGFAFVGPPTVYSRLQACGLVDDHLTTCPVRDDVEELRAALTVPC